MKLELRLVMADPAGNRTAIVRTPVPAALRAQAAAAILERKELRAEQAGFETAPVQGGAGRLEMMGGEFCGNAARSYGYYLWRREQLRKEQLRKEQLSKEPPSKSAESAEGVEDEKSADGVKDGESVKNDSADFSVGRIRIEISGSDRPLEVECDLRTGTSFAEMPMPLRLEYSPEGYPLVISEGITHMILRDTAPSEALVCELIGRYGKSADAFGIQFLEGDRLTPFVYVAGADSRVWESSCGSGSLAAAWYLERTGAGTGQRATAEGTPDSGMESGQAEKPGLSVPAGSFSGAERSYVLQDGSRVTFFRFREPGGELLVEIRRAADGTVTGRMGGKVTMEEEQCVELEIAPCS